MADMRARSGSAIVLVLIIALLPMLYVLSAGPVVWLYNRGMLGEDSPIWLVYVPLGFAAEKCDVFENVLTWYLHFWDPAHY
jgi:hypothetical protein